MNVTDLHKSSKETNKTFSTRHLLGRSRYTCIYKEIYRSENTRIQDSMMIIFKLRITTTKYSRMKILSVFDFIFDSISCPRGRFSLNRLLRTGIMFLLNFCQNRTPDLLSLSSHYVFFYILWLCQIYLNITWNTMTLNQSNMASH